MPKTPGLNIEGIFFFYQNRSHLFGLIEHSPVQVQSIPDKLALSTGLCNAKGCKSRGEMVWYPWGFRNGKFNYFLDEDDVKCPVCENKIVIYNLGFKDTWYQISGFRRASKTTPLKTFKESWKHAGGTNPVINFYGEQELDLWAEMEIELSQHDPSAPPPQKIKPPAPHQENTTSKDPNDRTPRKPKQYYILIGINHYMVGPKKKSEDGREWKYGHLHGCVRDINAVEFYLKHKLEVDPDNIFKLLAEHEDMNTNPNWKKAGPAGNPEKWPTHNNITALLKKVTNLAQEGDLIYIHYAGHGGRTQPTAFPGIKIGIDQSDESLVPCDIHTPGGKYILDLELASYLNTIVKKGITLTVILDSCHSSSASRAGEPESEHYTPRGGSGVDANPPSPTLTEADILCNLQGVLRGHQSRNAIVDTIEDDSNAFWLNPTGYELIAACRFDQTAKENSTIAGAEGSHGIFTYYYLEALRQSYPHSISHQQMHQRLQKLIDMKQYNQSPVFFGAGDRALFSQEHVQDNEATVGVSSGGEDGTVTLDIGAIHGVRIGAEFRLFPSNAREPLATDLDPRVKITEVKELKSIAEFLPESPKLAREQLSGGQYRAVSLSSPIQPIHVYLQTKGSDDKRFDELRQVLEGASDIPVDFESRLDKATYQVQIDPDGKYALYHVHRLQSQHLFSPVLDFPLTDNPNLFMDGLTHLAKFMMVKELKNLDQTLLLGHNFEFKVIRSPNGKWSPVTLRKYRALYFRFILYLSS